MTMTTTNTTTTTSPTSSWTSELKVKQLKQLVALIPSSSSSAYSNVGCCVERSDLEELVQTYYGSSRDAQSTLYTVASLQRVLSQDRNVLNFEEYTVSDRHKQRLQELAKVAPELYDNPAITPRSQWFNHPKYYENSQMPPFHVHFRQELQATLQYLYQAFNGSESSSDVQRLSNIRSAQRYFASCMRGLNGHVSIEEYACFPLYEQIFPSVKLRFLYDDHYELHQKEDLVKQAFNTFLGDTEINCDRIEIIKLIKVVLDFDDHLMRHLGEEEELVVPLSLTSKPVHF
jgi:hypothetical protein